MAKAAGVLHVCDSTFATPVMTKPIELGADMTLQVRRAGEATRRRVKVDRESYSTNAVGWALGPDGRRGYRRSILPYLSRVKDGTPFPPILPPLPVFQISDILIYRCLD